MIFYKTSGRGFSEIVPVEVERETEVSVFIKGSRCAKTSDWTQYHKTWEEAKKHVVDRTRAQFERIYEQLEDKREELQKALNLFVIINPKQ